MGKNDLEVKLLLDQRNTLISDIKELNSNMFKVIIAIIPLIVAIFVSYFPEINETSAYIIRYVVLEIILILSMIICACLFAANVDRDYISAIDTYLFDKFDISVLFYSGELSKKHTTGTKGVFPLTTALIGCSCVGLIMFFLVYIVIQDVSFYIGHIYLFVFSLAQILVYVVIVCANFKRKFTKKSIITEDCLNYMKRPKGSAKEEKIAQS